MLQLSNTKNATSNCLQQPTPLTKYSQGATDMAKAILAIPLNFHNRTPVPAWHRKHLQYAIDAVNGYTPDKTWQPLSLLAVSLDMHAMGKGDLGGEYAFTNEEREILIQGAAILHDAYMNDRRTNRTADPGYVYLMRAVAPEVNWYKIGLSIDPNFRLKTFNAIKLPFAIELVCTIQTTSMRELERHLHQRFADQRVRGEWFDLDDADVEYIEGLAR